MQSSPKDKHKYKQNTNPEDLTRAECAMGKKMKKAKPIVGP